MPVVLGVDGSGVSSALRGVAVSLVGFVLTRLGDRSGAIEDYQAHIQGIGMAQLMLQDMCNACEY